MVNVSDVSIMFTFNGFALIQTNERAHMRLSELIVHVHIFKKNVLISKDTRVHQAVKQQQNLGIQQLRVCVESDRTHYLLSSS